MYTSFFNFFWLDNFVMLEFTYEIIDKPVDLDIEIL